MQCNRFDFVFNHCNSLLKLERLKGSPGHLPIDATSVIFLIPMELQFEWGFRPLQMEGEFSRLN